MIVLIGFMGAGKTTIGRRLAAHLGAEFVDSDHVIEERIGCTVQTFFAREGEPAFRALEEQTIVELLDGPPCILALGGGAIGSTAVRDRLADHEVVYLHAPLAEVLTRVGGDVYRPMLHRPDLQGLYDGRLEVYESLASITAQTGGRDPGQVTEEVLAALGSLDRSGAGEGAQRAGSGPRLVLVGPAGSGKTTVAQLVAERLGLAVREVDRDIEALAGASVSDVFIESGEARFRELERTASLAALRECDGIVELGGGAVLDPQVRAALAHERVVFLDVGIADAAKRIGFDANPAMVVLVPRRSWIRHMQQRRPIYTEVATWVVDTSARSAADVADQVVALVDGESA
ncbi:shikimate kinase [Arsenicicoccus piscis]|uniref:Shikimate kinase n=1 Tax=Arsenicicoccus piscis TaxID=673954 RepID=A0ABQ6HN81_9MICO|nr:shikimate kinase [Arsenicicoccus piscis]GMA19065.1 hypothetical protein GCM10025862_10860 [Arsenicicoccus piscis]